MNQIKESMTQPSTLRERAEKMSEETVARIQAMIDSGEQGFVPSLDEMKVLKELVGLGRIHLPSEAVKPEWSSSPWVSNSMGNTIGEF